MHVAAAEESLANDPGQAAISIGANEAVKATIKNQLDAVAIIEGDGGSGTGFIATESGKTWLYTAAHVITGNKRLAIKNNAGRKFAKFGDFQVAANSDLVRIELLEEFQTGLRIAKHGSAKADEPVLAIGNSAGAGVLTVLEGWVVSLGPDLLEVSSDVIQGNSGGPVFSGKNGDVLGVVTHLVAAREDLWSKDTQFAEVRRFATRLDREVVWQTVPITRFIAEAKMIEDYNRNTRVIFAISVLNPTQEGLRLNMRVAKDGPTLLSIFEESKDLPVVAELFEMNGQLGDKRLRTSESDLRKRFTSYYNSAVSKLTGDSDKFTPNAFSGYHREQAEQAVKWRNESLIDLKSAASRLR
jgi:hypothetical protein